MKSLQMKFVIFILLIALVVGCQTAPDVVTEEPLPPEELEVVQVTGIAEVDEWGAEIKSRLGGTTLRLAVASHPSTEAFKQMNGKFQELTGIILELDEQEEGALGQKLLLESTAAQPSYDIIMSYPEAMPTLAGSGYLEPLDDYINDPSKTPAWFDYEDILQAYRDMMIFEGPHYAIPFAGETVFLFYRQDLFEKYDYPVPTTMDELLEAAAFFDGLEEGLSGISMRTRVGWEFTYMWSVFIFPFGGEMLDPTMTTPGLDKPETIASLQYLIDIMEYAPPGVESFSFPEAWDAFMQGKTALMVEASAAAPEVENMEKSVVAGNVGYAPMPAGPAGAYSGVWGWGYGMPAGSPNKEAAYAYIMYMTSKAMQDDYIAAGGIPSRSSYLLDSEKQAENPYFQATLDTLDQAADLLEKGYGVVIPILEWSAFSDILGTEGGMALIGQQTPEEACRRMQNLAEELLN